MKTLHKLMTAGAALAFVGMASAQTTVRITGSTAFRKATQIAILHLMGSTDGSTLPSGTYGYSGTGGLSSANASAFIGMISGQSVIVSCSWSGSAHGVQSVAGGFQSPYLPTSDYATFTASGKGGYADPTVSGNPGDNELSDINMSDTYQSTSPFNGTFNTVTYAHESDTPVGVVTFEWVASHAAPSTLTNITPELAQATWVGFGNCPLALYTGNSADQQTLVYATGRDADSGTRLNAFSESGIGGQTAVVQYDPSQPTGTVYADETINGIAYTGGNGGESSGGKLATKMGNNNTDIYVSYLGISDAATLLSAPFPGKVLTWNGVAYSDAAIQQGQYTFWGYEHLMHLSSLSGVGLTVANALANQIINTDAVQSGELLSSMAVLRSTDGGTVVANY